MAGAIVQFVEAVGATSATTIGVAITCTAGNFLHVSTVSDDATATCADTGSNTYGAEKGSVIEAAITRRLHHFAAAITTGGTITVTVTFGASVAGRQIIVTEISGVSAYDAQGTATDTGNNPTDPATATNSAQPAFGIAVNLDYQGGTPGVGTGYTSGGLIAGTGLFKGRIQYRSFTTAAAQTANFVNAGFDRTCTVFAIFLESGGAGSHPTTGALAAQSATAAGTAAHLTLHATTGALAAQAATVAGTAADHHSNIGALAAAAATVAGTATHLTLHTSSGALAGQAATIAGTAADQFATTGALAAGAATVAGTADHTVAGATHPTSGALAAAAATMAGTSVHLTLHATSGALAAQAATIAGTAADQFATTGALSGQAATVAGAAAHLTLHASSGALAAQAASLSGAAADQFATTGALTAQAATISGTAVHAAAGSHPTSGALVAGDATVSGVAQVVTFVPDAPPGKDGAGVPMRKWRYYSDDQPEAANPQKPAEPTQSAPEPKAPARAVATPASVSLGETLQELVKQRTPAPVVLSKAPLVDYEAIERETLRAIAEQQLIEDDEEAIALALEFLT